MKTKARILETLEQNRLMLIECRKTATRGIPFGCAIVPYFRPVTVAERAACAALVAEGKLARISAGGAVTFAY